MYFLQKNDDKLFYWKTRKNNFKKLKRITFFFRKKYKNKKLSFKKRNKVNSKVLRLKKNFYIYKQLKLKSKLKLKKTYLKKIKFYKKFKINTKIGLKKLFKTLINKKKKKNLKLFKFIYLKKIFKIIKINKTKKKIKNLNNFYKINFYIPQIFTNPTLLKKNKFFFFKKIYLYETFFTDVNSSMPLSGFIDLRFFFFLLKKKTVFINDFLLKTLNYLLFFPKVEALKRHSSNLFFINFINFKNNFKDFYNHDRKKKETKHVLAKKKSLYINYYFFFNFWTKPFSRSLYEFNYFLPILDRKKIKKINFFSFHKINSVGPKFIKHFKILNNPGQILSFFLKNSTNNNLFKMNFENITESTKFFQKFLKKKILKSMRKEFPNFLNESLFNFKLKTKKQYFNNFDLNYKNLINKFNKNKKFFFINFFKNQKKKKKKSKKYSFKKYSFKKYSFKKYSFKKKKKYYFLHKSNKLSILPNSSKMTKFFLLNFLDSILYQKKIYKSIFTQLSKTTVKPFFKFIFQMIENKKKTINSVSIFSPANHIDFNSFFPSAVLALTYCWKNTYLLFQTPLFFKTLRLVKANFSSTMSTVFCSTRKNLSNFISNLFIDEEMLLSNYKKFLGFSLKSKISQVFFYFSQTCLIKFFEHCTNKKIILRFDPFILKNISNEDIDRCVLWGYHLREYKKSLGPRFYLTEALHIITISLRLNDPYLLSNWMLSIFNKMNFWKYKSLFNFMQYTLRYFFWPHFFEYGIKGLRFQLKGKVSVAGNGRTRTVRMQIGSLGHSKKKNKILTNLNLLRTFTGVIGFQTWLVF